MRRSHTKVAAVLGALTLALAPTTPAVAATEVTTGMPDGFDLYKTICDGGEQGDGSGTVRTVSGPTSAPPPLGTGSLRFRQGSPEDIIGMAVNVDSLASMTEWSFDLYDPSSATGAVVAVDVDGDFWQGELLALGGASWTTVDLLSEPFVWTNQTAPHPGDGSSATVGEFVAAFGDSSAFLLLARADCADATQGMNTFIDGLTLGIDGSSTTHDFEAGPPKPKVTMTVKDSLLRPGNNVVVTGDVEPAMPGATVLLKRKTANGAKKFGTGVMAENGKYKIVRELKKKGTYKLFVAVPASQSTRAAKSRVVTVTVGR